MVAKSRTPNVKAMHPEYARMLTKWTLVRDVLAGQSRIKECTVKYLPMPSTEESDEENAARYKTYLEGAVFYGVTQRTLEGLVGQVFSKPPTTDFPDEVKYLMTDPAGTGVTLEQQAKAVLGDLLSLGRGLLWTDYPTKPTPTTLAEKKAGTARPIITYYKPEDVLNWRVRRVGVLTKISLVVLRETYVIEDDGFEAKEDVQYRVLRLTDDNVYTIEIWRPMNKDRKYDKFTTFTPVDGKGNVFDTIPCVFVGIENNDSTVDFPPLYSMSILNIAHYRNSAEYEESCFMMGQPTLWYAGVTEEWNATVLKGKVYIGSRGGLPLLAGGSAGLLQAEPNTLAKEAMDQKEEQMVALGARLVQSSGVRRTATEVTGDKVSEMSVLASAARNTSQAYLKIFEFCQMFSNDNVKVQFELSTDFDMARMTSQDLLALFTLWQGKILTTGETRNKLRSAGIATEKLEDAIAAGVLKEAEAPAAVQESVDNRASQA